MAEPHYPKADNLVIVGDHDRASKPFGDKIAGWRQSDDYEPSALDLLERLNGLGDRRALQLEEMESFAGDLARHPERRAIAQALAELYKHFTANAHFRAFFLFIQHLNGVELDIDNLDLLLLAGLTNDHDDWITYDALRAFETREELQEQEELWEEIEELAAIFEEPYPAPPTKAALAVQRLAAALLEARKQP